MSSENFLLLVRLGFSLSLVFGLMWVAAKMIRGRGAALLRSRVDHLEVIERKPLGKGSSIAIVRVGDDTLTVGITESSISLLGHAEIELLADADAASGVETPTAPVVALVPPGDTGTTIVRSGERRSLLDSLRDKTVRHVAR